MNLNKYQYTIKIKNAYWEPCILAVFLYFFNFSGQPTFINVGCSHHTFCMGRNYFANYFDSKIISPHANCMGATYMYYYFGYRRLSIWRTIKVIFGRWVVVVAKGPGGASVVTKGNRGQGLITNSVAPLSPLVTTLVPCRPP